MKKQIQLLFIIPLIMVSCSKKYTTIDQEVGETLVTVKELVQKEKYRQVVEKLSLKINQYNGVNGLDSLVYYLGISYIELEEFDLGATQLRRFSDNFRTSPLRPSAQYFIAQSYVRRLPIASRYQDITTMALRELNFFTELFPDDTLMIDVKKDIKTCRNLLAENVFEVGEFYFRKDEFSPARAQFSDVLDNYLDTDVSDNARTMLAMSYVKLNDLETSKKEFEIIDEKKVSQEYLEYYNLVKKAIY